MANGPTKDDARPYVVQPQDTVWTIALRHGVEPDAIVARNPEMFGGDAARDPQMLAPGEVLYIPPPAAPPERVAPRGVHRFVGRVPRVHLHLAFADASGPLADEPFEAPGAIRVPGEGGERDPREPLTGNLDGAGQITLAAPALLRSFRLTFPELRRTHRIDVGALDPVDQRQGRASRLRHMGFLPVDQALTDPFRFETETAERETLEAYQRARGLAPSGFADPPTLEHLVDEHGC